MHLSTSETGKIALGEAIKAYEEWSAREGIPVESNNSKITHEGFEELLSELRENEINIEPKELSRLVERFSNVEPYILDEYETKELIKNYPNIVFGEWRLGAETADNIDLLLKKQDEEKVMLVDIAFEKKHTSLGRLLHERERFKEYDAEACIVVLSEDKYFKEACENAEIEILEIGAEHLLELINNTEWKNLQSLTLTP